MGFDVEDLEYVQYLLTCLNGWKGNSFYTVEGFNVWSEGDILGHIKWQTSPDGGNYQFFFGEYSGDN